MAFVKTRQQPQTQNRVGSSYGERRQLMQNPTAPARAQKPVAQKAVDKFANSKGPQGSDFSKFASNARFRKTNGSITARGKPYKKSLHDHVEQGSAPAKANVTPPSDRVILNFLDKVIANAPKRRTTRTQSNVAIRSKPLNKVETKADKTASSVKPRLPRTGRPIPNIAKSRT